MAVLTDAEWRALNPRGPANDKPDPPARIAERVLPTVVIGELRKEVLGSHGVSASAGMYTAQGTNLLTATAIGSTTAAAGTQMDFGRNVAYEINISGDATGMVASGTISIAGWDLRSQAMTETVALTDIASVGSTGAVLGTKLFARFSGSAITISGYELATASSSRSASISLFLGSGNIVGLPNSIQSTNAIPWAWIGTANQVGSFTVQTGDVGTAGVSFSNALASATPVQVLRYVSL